MPRYPQIPLLAILAWLTACPFSYGAEEVRVDSRLAKLFGHEGMRTIQSPDKVELYRISKKDPEGEPAQFVAGWPVGDRRTTANWVAVAASAIVAATGTYDFPVPGTVWGTFCGGFDPTFLVRFSRGNQDPVDVLFSYRCQMIAVVQPESREADALGAGPSGGARLHGIRVVPTSESGTAKLLALISMEYELDADARKTLGRLVLNPRNSRPRKSTAVQHGVAPGDRSPAAPARR